MEVNSSSPGAAEPTGTEQNTSHDTKAKPKEFPLTSFWWIENEGLLRDEGVICGLSGVDPKHKIESIDSYYEERKSYFAANQADIEKQITFLQSVQLDHNLKIAKYQVTFEQTLPVSSSDQLNVLRYSTGLLLIIGMCIFPYFIIYDALKKTTEYPHLISLGTFLVGMFGLFAKLSYFFREPENDPASPAVWKQILLEAGLPFAAALYTVTCGYSVLGTARSIATFILIFLIFLLAGKLFLSILLLLQRDLKTLKDRSASSKAYEERKQSLGAASKFSKDKVDEIEQQVGKLIEESRKIPSAETLEANKTTRIKIFLSEYDLAKEYRSSHKKESHLILNGVAHE